MSSDQIEQTKQQIRGLVAEIAQLSKSDLEGAQYYQQFLDRVVTALAAVGGAIWVLGDDQKVNLAYQIAISESLLDAEQEDAQRHNRLLQQVMNGTEGHLIPPLSGTSEDGSAGNPTEFLLVLVPLMGDEKCEGVVEVFQRPNAQPATQRGYLRFLTNMAELASEWLKSRKLKQLGDRHNLWAQADHFSRLVHDTLNLRETCYAITNEGRRMIGCDRVSVAIKRGARCKIEAVSGQDTIEDRSNVVHRLGVLASKVCAMGEPLWYEGSTEDFPPQIEQTLEEYVDDSYTKTMTILPIRRPKSSEMRIADTARSEAQIENNESNEIIGALIIEQLETDLPRVLMEPRIDLVYEHSARALSNAIAHNSLFLMPVWNTLGSLSVVTKARNLPKTLAVAAALVAALVVLFFVPGKFRLKCEGSLQPTMKQDVFVTVSGIVRKVKVHDQQDVTKGTELVILENPDLKQEQEAIQGEYDSQLSSLLSIQSELTRGASQEQRRQLEFDLDQAESKVNSLRKQLEVLNRKIDELIIRSPMDGKVMLSWSVEKSLIGKPVEPSQVLMSIADPNKPWELDLFLPEKRVGHVRTARREIKEELDVDYYLATKPGDPHLGTIRYMDPVTRLDAEDGHGVRVLVKIEKSEHTPSELRVGARVTAKVLCGRRSLGYCWFHEAFEWVQGLLF